ncbi:MAG: aminotransferase class III-fold pyridoxal phosphate-dependent enzyme [Chloroflexi bacterium]|nr:aminotransferase class III-fold pyridoxal phosphate-dependent enzyme [Chloroflexota bacterium]
MSWSQTYKDQRPRAVELYAEAQQVIAGGVGHDVRHNPLAPIYIQYGRGSRKWDVDGNEYIDYGMGNGALLLGHAHPGVLQAVQSVVESGLHFGNDHPQMLVWAKLIRDLIPCAERVRFDNSGTEGTMLALRLARAYTGRTKVLRFEGHFSGWHDYVGRGAYPPFDRSVSLGIPQSTLETIVVIPADLDRVEQVLRQDPDIAAVMLEPSGASWGTVPLTADFNRGLRALTSRYEVPLIYDEVITGFRYSPGGYQGLIGVTPDLAVLGKIVTGGLPGGAVVGRADIMRLFDFTGDAQHDRFGRVSHLGTFNANPLSTASGIASLRLVADGSAQAHADRMADLLRRGMEEILEEEHAAGYAYGDSSVFHVYLEAYPGRGAASRADLHTTDARTLKSIPGSVVTAFQRNLNIRGVDLMSYAGGVTSAAHTEQDVQETLDAFRETIRVMLAEQILARVG